MENQPTITIKNMEIYTGYEFNPDDCKLCRNSLMAPSLPDLNNEDLTQIEMLIIIGKCGHYFHKKCISNFQNTGYVSCPTCNVSWEVQDIVNCYLNDNDKDKYIK